MSRTDPLWPTASEWLANTDPHPVLVLLGLPTSIASLSPSDAWETPAALRRLLTRFASFDGEAGVDLAELPVADAGDLTLAHLSVYEVIDRIRAAVAELPTDPVHAFVGGDNLVTYPIVAGLPHAPLERTGLLTLDAHHDVRLTDPEPTNGSPVRALVEAGMPGDHVIQIGIHSFANSAPYRQWCVDQGIRMATMTMVDEHGIGHVVDQALDALADSCDAIHVDVDLDVLDRAFAPACPGSRPGGMTPRQLTEAVRRCGRHPKVVSADFVEVDATRDLAETTMMSLATTFLAFASGIARRRRT